MKMKAGQSQDLKCPASVGFEVLMVVTANITVFWVMIPYSLLPTYGHVGVWHHIRHYLIVQLSKHHVCLLHIIDAKQGTSNQMSPCNICHCR